MSALRTGQALLAAATLMMACQSTGTLQQEPTQNFTGSISPGVELTEQDLGHHWEISTREYEAADASLTLTNGTDTWVRILISKQSGERQILIDAYLVWTQESWLRPLEAEFGVPQTKSVVNEFFVDMYCDPNPGNGCSHFEHVSFTVPERALLAASAGAAPEDGFAFRLVNEAGRVYEGSVLFSEFAQALELARSFERTEIL